MRRLTLLAVLITGGMCGITSAYAASPRQAASDQYTSPPVVGAGTTDTTPTTTGSSGGNGGSSGNGGGNGNGNSGGSGGGTSTGSGGGAGGSASATVAGASATAAITVAVLDFGQAPKKLRQDIQAAIAQAGLRSSLHGITEQRFRAFLASPLLKLLSPKGPRAAGQAFGAQIVNPTAALRQAFPVLFGTAFPTDPVKQAVLTRRPKLSARQVAVLTGVSDGIKSTGIPLAYVERSDAKKSFVAAFKKRKILTVGDVDTAAGKTRLAKILLGQITTQKAVDAVKVSPASAVISNADGSTGGAPWLLLIALVGGGAAMATGAARRRRRAGDTV